MVQLNSLDKEYRRRFVDWLPDTIFDIHTHVGLPSHHSPISSERMRSVGLSAGQDQPFDVMERDFAEFLPGKKIFYCTFPFSFREINIAEANRYVLAREYPLVLADLSDEGQAVELLEIPQVRGLKVYHDFVRKPYSEREIVDFVRPSWMQALHREEKVLMLHVPGRSLNEERNLGQLEHLSNHYPGARIILAHMGFCHCPDDFFSIIPRVKPLKNVVLDTSAVSNPEVFRMAFEELGPKRVLYGSDSPYSSKRWRIMEVPGPMKHAFISADEEPWTLPALRKWYLDNQPPITYLLYHELRALKLASQSAGLSRSEIESVFHDNAFKLMSR